MSGLSIEFVLDRARAYVKAEQAKHMAEHGTNPKRNHRLDSPWMQLSAIDDIEFFNGYAPGCGDPDAAVVSGNWNRIADRTKGFSSMVPAGEVMTRLERIFESMGVGIEWCDQCTGCSECYACITTYECEPARYIVGDGYIVCRDCADWDEELAGIAKAQGQVPANMVDPSEYGYTQVRELESWYHGRHRVDRVRDHLKSFDHFTMVETCRGLLSLWVRTEDVPNLPTEIEGDEV